MIKNCKNALDQGKGCGPILNYLCKAFNCLPHDLKVVKLYAFSFSMESMTLINSYLTEPKQRVKKNDQFSS